MTNSYKAYDLNDTLERLFVWSGFGWVTLATLGFFGSGLVPAKNPSTDPLVLVAFLKAHKVILQFGMQCILIGGYSFMMTWGLVLSYQIRKYANPSPLIFGFNNMLVLGAAIIGMLTGVFGSMILLRLDRIDPATIQGFYDLIWFMFLIPWPPFTIWQFLVGAAILSKTNDQTVFPRWIGYFSFWAGVLEVPAGFAMFWYDGPFAYNGAISFWVPGVSFFIWVFVLACVQVRGLARIRAETPALEPQERFRRAIGPAA